MNLGLARAFTAAQGTEAELELDAQQKAASASAGHEQQLREAEAAAAAWNGAATPYEQRVDSILARLVEETAQYGFNPVPTGDCANVRTCETPESLAETLDQQVKAVGVAADGYSTALSNWRKAMERHLYATALLHQQQHAWRQHQNAWQQHQYQVDAAAARIAADNNRRTEVARRHNTWVVAVVASIPLLCCGLFLMWIPFAAAFQITRMAGATKPQRQRAELAWGGLYSAGFLVNWVLSTLLTNASSPIHIQAGGFYAAALLTNVLAIPGAIFVWKFSSQPPKPPNGWQPQYPPSGPQPHSQPGPPQPLTPPPSVSRPDLAQSPRPQPPPPGGPHHG